MKEATYLLLSSFKVSKYSIPHCPCPCSSLIEHGFVELMQEHPSLVRVDLRHGKGRKGHRLGLIRLVSPLGHAKQVPC